MGESEMKLASIEIVKGVIPHPNADLLDIVTVLGYQAIVKRGQWSAGDYCVFIQPDTVLPDTEWAQFYKAKSNRVKAIRLRGEWSMGIVESIKLLPEIFQGIGCEEGIEVSGPLELNIQKYEAPQPNNLDAKGNLPYGIFKTDEERWQNIKELPFGELCDVTLKIDGSSMTVYCKKVGGEWVTGVCSRSLELKLDSSNVYTRAEKKLDLMNKLKAYCVEHDASLAIRGEVFGKGVQMSNNNPHSKMELWFNAFSVLDLDTLKYIPFRGNPGVFNACFYMGIPVVPVLESVELSEDVIKCYDYSIIEVDGNPFEGVVLKFEDGRSFKVINKHYDAKK